MFDWLTQLARVLLCYVSWLFAGIFQTGSQSQTPATLHLRQQIINQIVLALQSEQLFTDFTILGEQTYTERDAGSC